MSIDDRVRRRATPAALAPRERDTPLPGWNVDGSRTASQPPDPPRASSYPWPLSRIVKRDGLDEAPRSRPLPNAPSPSSHASQDAFEAQLARDILLAERSRAALLASIFTVAVFALVVAAGAYPDVVVTVLHGNVDIAPVGLFLVAVAAFEFYELRWLSRQLRRGEKPKVLRRYLQALLEASLPTVAILYYAAIDGPEHALRMPIASVYFVFILLSTLRLDFALSIFTGLVAAAEYAAVAFAWGGATAVATGGPPASPPSFADHVGKATILVVSGVAAGFVAQRIRRSFSRAIASVGERQRILDVFGQHVSPEIVQQLVADKAEVTSEIRDVCIMFLDIRNFTALSETKPPAEVVDYLNAVFEPAVEAVVTRSGVVNKFLGDGFMAVFGAPVTDARACRNAVASALDIVRRIDALVEDGVLPPTTLGIGLHAGKAVVGNIGSTQRKEYTVIGDVVNVASRVEALNKEFGSRILATDEVWSACANDAELEASATARNEIAIRGRSRPVRVWQLD